MESWKIIISLVVVLLALGGVGAYVISEANHNLNDSNGSVNVSNNDGNHPMNNTTNKLENNTFNESNKDTVSVNKAVNSKNIKNNKESVSPKHVSSVNKTVANHKNVVSNKKSTNPTKSVDSKDIGYKKSLAIAEGACHNESCLCGHKHLKITRYVETPNSRVFVFDQIHCGGTYRYGGIEVIKSTGFTYKA